MKEIQPKKSYKFQLLIGAMNLSNVKLVVSDMDGTLLNSNGKVSSLFFELFQQLKKQNIHFIVPKTKFHLLQGEEYLTTYTFNTHKAKHTFCKVCGVQSFYTPRSNPDGVGIMPHCIDGETLKEVKMEYFNGTEWEKTIKTETGLKIQAFSKENWLVFSSLIILIT